MQGGQFAALTGAVKLILKRKGVTYQDLAGRIGMSESGVKKLLTAEDGSVSRLESICTALGISLFDLVQTVAEDEPVQEFSLSQAIQEYFVSNIDCFHVYWKLSYEERPSEVIAAELGLSARDYAKHLHQLDRFNLITLKPGNRVSLPKRGHHVWAAQGPLVDYLRRHWSTTLLQEVLSEAEGGGTPQHHLSLRYLRLTTASAADLIEAVRLLNEEFGNRSLRERSVNAEGQLVSMRMMAAIAPGSYITTQPDKNK